MVCVRFDLSFAVGVVFHHSSNPRPTHWQVVKWIFHYVKGTQTHGLRCNSIRRKKI
jgi:hypothetical protein